MRDGHDDMRGERDGERDESAWWATGDAPPRRWCQVEPLVDGRATMLAMCKAFLAARRYILLAGWDLRADLPLVRAADARLANDATPEGSALLASLRADGLDDDAIAFWNTGALRVKDALGFAARRGVRVGVLLWDAYHLGSHLTNDAEKQAQALAEVGVDVALDDSSRAVTHITQSLHQKCAVVDGLVAFVGGIDLTAQYGGDYDRWDLATHLCDNPARIQRRDATAHPWHDAHTRLRGPVVGDVQRNITQRWGEVAERRGLPDWPVTVTRDGDAEDDTTHVLRGVEAQILRTIPPHTYTFAPQGIATIKDAYLRAFAQARSFVYLENQYLWPRVFEGLDRLCWGGPSPDMREVLEAMAAALRRGVRIGLTLPDHPNVGRRFTDEGVEWLREQAPQARDHLHVFTLGAFERDAKEPGGVFYRPIYVHAKLAIVDDQWWTVGSANLNNRGMRADAELNVATLDRRTAQALRLSLWSEHLDGARDTLGALVEVAEPDAGLRALQQLAEANRERVRQRQPLAGHVLPYLTEEDGKRLELPVHPEHGWLDNLDGAAGALPDEVAGRYL